MATKKTSSYTPESVLGVEDICNYLELSKPTVLKLLRPDNPNGIVAGKIGRKWKVLFKNVEEYRLRILEGGAIQRTLHLK